MKQEQPDVISEGMTDHDTWNTCPKCKHSWKDDVYTPGIIHRIRLCARCIMKTEHGKNRIN